VLHYRQGYLKIRALPLSATRITSSGSSVLPLAVPCLKTSENIYFLDGFAKAIEAISRLLSRAVLQPEGTMAFDAFEEQEEVIENSMDLEMIRDDLIAELKSINEYEAQVEMIDNEDAADTIEQILEDKKFHVARLVHLLSLLDPVQAEKLNKELR